MRFVCTKDRRQEAWRNLCESLGLKEHRSTFPSFHHHNGTSDSFLDLFAASSTLSMQEIIQYCTLESPLNLSSHDPIESSINIQLDAADKKSKFKDTYSEFNRKKISWDVSKLPEYQKLADEALSNALSYWNSPESIPLLSSLVSSLLVSCATMVFDSRSTCIKAGPKKASLKIRQARNALNVSFNTWKKAGKPSNDGDPSRAKYREARAHLQRLSRYEENLRHIRQNNHLMDLDHSNRSKIFATVKKF